MRRLALPIVLALAVCGIATTAAFAPTLPASPQTVRQSMDEHEMQLLAAVSNPPSVPADSAINQMITVSASQPAAMAPVSQNTAARGASAAVVEAR